VIFVLALAAPCAARAQAEELPAGNAEAEPVPTSPAPPATTAPAQVANPTVALPARGLLFVPSFGLNLPVGILDESYSAGFHVGALAGWHLTDRLSLNGEIALDLMDADNDGSMLKPREYYLDALFSPLVHLRSGDVVVGPKIGWFINRRTESASSTTSMECLYLTGTRSGCGNQDAPTVVPHSGQGFLVGVNAAGFVPVGKLRLGLWASGTFGRFVTASCGGSSCASELGNVVTLSLALAALL